MKPSLRQSSRCRHFSASIKALAFTGLAAGAMLGFGSVASAQNKANFWTVAEGNFNDPALWSLGRVPVSPAPDGGNDDANVFNGGTVTINTDGLVPNDVNAGGTRDGVAGNGTYIQTAGSIAIGSGGGWFRLGTSGGTTGTYNLQGGALTFVSNGDGQINVGEAGGSTGAINMSGGTFNITNLGQMTVARGGATGTFNMSAGTFTNNGGSILVGLDGGANGTLTISGGTFNNQTGGNHVSIGDGNGAIGTATLSGSGTLNTNGELWIGQRGGATGTFNMTGGTLNAHNWVAIGRDSSSGTFNMSGGTLTKDSLSNSGSHIVLAGIGTNQTAVFNQSGGDAIVASGGNTVWIGETGNGIWNISGGTLQANDGIVLGQAGGGGTLNIQSATEATGPLANGGGNAVVTSPVVYLGSTEANNNFTSATVNLNGGTLATGGFAVGAGTGIRTVSFNGGTLRATLENAEILGGTAVLAPVRAGGAIIDTNGFNVGTAVPLVSDGATVGGLTKRGAGVLTLTGGNTYTGATAVQAGTLANNGSIGVNQVPGTAGAVTVTQGAVLTGIGAFNLGASAVTINGTLSLGATAVAGDVGNLTVQTSGTITLASTAIMAFDIANAGSKDLLTATGATLVITSGGTLALRGTVAANTTYTLVSGLVAENGNFTNVTGQPANTTANFSFAGGNYNVVFVPIPEPGTWALGVFGLGVGALLMRRRQRATA